ncbi:protein phosphatase, putative [Leishmania panamensis]|uniref:protein-serine/threonine phosphatase n=1 Tax=Leishmania panamensis TaxID=5679 RepID=A0A088S2I8_LEIPA|nr:protein phosphatase, putative [Leishmania panamensis]AIN95646.1 protein phosphatase, putative [Leishmania panamensis]
MDQPRMSSTSLLVASPVMCTATRVVSSSTADREEVTLASVASGTSAPGATRSSTSLPTRFVSEARGSSPTPSTQLLAGTSSLSRDSTWATPAPNSNHSNRDSSSSSRGCRPLSPPLVQTTPVSTTATTTATLQVTHSQQVWRAGCEMATITSYTGDGVRSVAGPCQEAEACRGCSTIYRCSEPSASSSSSFVSAAATTKARARRSERRPSCVVQAELMDSASPGEVRSRHCVNAAAAAVPVTVRGFASNSIDVPADLTGAPLSDELVPVGAPVRERSDLHAVSRVAEVDSIAVTRTATSPTSSSPLTLSAPFQLRDTGTSDVPCWQMSPGEDGSCPEGAEYINLLELLTRASSTHEGLDAASTDEVVPPLPGMDTVAHVEEPAACSPSPDVPLDNALSAIHIPKVGSVSRSDTVERADVNNLEFGEHKQAPVFRSLSLSHGLIDDDAAPHTGRAKEWQSAVASSRSQHNIAAALASSGRTVQETGSNSSDGPSVMLLHNLVAPRLSPWGTQLESRGDMDNDASAESARPTPLLALSEAHHNGSGVFAGRQLRAGPSGTAATTFTDVAAPASTAAVVPATARSQSTTSSTPLLDSFRIVLSPCPSSIAPSFSLVPCPSTSRVSSPVSISARVVQQRWRGQVRACPGVGAGDACGTSPLPVAAHSLELAGGRALGSWLPPPLAHAAETSRSGRVAGDGAWGAVRVTPLQDWERSPWRSSGDGNAADEVTEPMPLHPTCWGTTANLSEGVSGLRRGCVSPSTHDAPVYNGPRSSCNHAATLSLRSGLPQPRLASLDATPPPEPRPQQLPDCACNSLALANAATEGLSRVSPAAHALSSPSLPRQAEPLPLLRPDHGQRDGSCSNGAAPWTRDLLSPPAPHITAFAPPTALQPSGGSVGPGIPAAAAIAGRCGDTCNLPLLTTAATTSVLGTSASASPLTTRWSEFYTRAEHVGCTHLGQAESGDAYRATSWSPTPVMTAYRYDSSFRLSPTDASSYSSSAWRLPAQPAHFATTASSLLQIGSFTDIACRCVADEATLTTDTSLAGADGEDFVSTCSTPPPRASLSLLSQRVPGCTSSGRKEDVCLWHATATSARMLTRTSSSRPRGSPLAGAMKASTESLWSPSLCTSPTAVTAVGDLGSKGGVGHTCNRGRGPCCSDAVYAVPADSDGLVHFGVESELCGLQRDVNAKLPFSGSLSSALLTSTGVALEVHQQASPTTPCVDSERGGADCNDVGSSSVYVPSALLLVPPPPLVALPAHWCSFSISSPRGGDWTTPTVAIRTADTTATTSAFYASSPRRPSPVPSIPEQGALLAASMAMSESLVEGGGVAAALAKGDDEAEMFATLDAPTDVTIVSAEGVSSLLPTSSSAVSPATQFQCAFSSLRGCRNRQEDSVMLVANLPVRMRSSAIAVPSTEAAHTAPASAREGSGASARSSTGAVGEHTQWAEDDSIAATAVTQHISSEQDEVVFACFGVFDGHCGDAVASLASQFFPEHFEHAVKSYQRQWEQDQRDSRGASRGAGSSAQLGKEVLGSCDCRPEGPVAEELRGHREAAPMEAVKFQRIVSAALVQALVHLDLTLYNVLHRDAHGPSVQRRDAGSTASVAVFFKLPTAAASCHSDTREVAGSWANGTSLLPTGNGDAPSDSDGSAATRPPGRQEEPWKQGEHCEAPTSPMPAAQAGDTYRLCIANLGDSRAIVGNLQTGEVVLRTTDHRISTYPSEAARIRAAGGVVELDRIDGSLDVTRGLGDYRYKVEPEQWWDSTAATAESSATGMPASASSALLAVSAAAAAVTSLSSHAEVVAGSLPPANTPRRSDAFEDALVMRELRWPSSSSTTLRSLMSDDVDGGGATLGDSQRASNVGCTDGEAQSVSAPLSQESPPSDSAERMGDAHTIQEEGSQQILAPSSLPPLSPSSPLSSRPTYASTSAVALTSNAVSNIADVYEWEVHRGEVLIIGSDGVWDRMTSEDALSFVRRELLTAEQQSKAAAGNLIHSNDTPVEASNGVRMRAWKSPGLDRAGPEVSGATGAPLVFFSETLEGTPPRQQSPCHQQRRTSACCYPAGLLCSPDGSGAASYDQDDAANLLASTAGSAPCLFAVQAAARRLTEHVVNNLFGSDNTSVVVVAFD